MLKYFFGDTAQVRVIQYLIDCETSWPIKYPSKEEIVRGAKISNEEFNKFYDDFIDIGFLIKCEGEDKYFMCCHELSDGLYFILQEIQPSYNRKMKKIELNNILKKCKKHQKFLNEHFKIDENDLNNICKLIVEDQGLEKIIYDLPQIILKELQESQIKLCMRNLFDENVLEIIVLTKINPKTSLKKEEKINDYISENYNAKNEFHILIKPL